jgi:hypothetical protein
MPGFSGYTLADEINNFIYRGVAITVGANLYVRLLIAPSSRSGGGTETDYGGYSRLALLRGTGLFAASVNGRLLNSASLVFGTPTSAGSGQLVAFDIVDTASGAFTKLYNGGPILPAKTVVINKPPTFRAGSLEITW